MNFIDPEFIVSVQSRIDALSPKARRKRLRQMQRLRSASSEVGLAWAVEWIALSQGVSVARAAEMLAEKVAHGSVRVTGVPVRDGAAIGPRKRIPPELFRGRPQ
jgi:hypothetical protein